MERGTALLKIFPVCLVAIGFLGLPLVVQGQGPGLYRDNEKILGFDDLIDVSERFDGATPPDAQVAGPLLYRQILGDQIGQRNRPQKDYIDAVFRLRSLVAQGAAIDEVLDLEPRLRIAHEAMLDCFDEVGEYLREKSLPPEKLGRLSLMVERHTASAERLLGLFDELRSARDDGNMSAGQAAIAEIERFFGEETFTPNRPLDPSLPRPMLMERGVPEVVDAAAIGPAVRYPALPLQGRDYDPADTLETPDVVFSDEILALADSLGNSPAAMYRYVRDNFEFEPYLGSRKGSQQTLSHRAGNDYDQASLLLALLRSSGYPARYATGTVKMPIDEATNWLGIDDKVNAASLLATAGMEGTLYIAGPDTVAIGCKRVWVEAWLPFVNYRGTVSDTVGSFWVPLDPAFKQYDYTPGINFPAEIGFDGAGFIDDYISSFNPAPPVEVFRQMLLDELPTYHPGATLEDIVTSRSTIPEGDGIIPGTLAFELLSYDGTYSEIPVEKRYYVRFHLYGEGTDLDYTTSIPVIAGKQVTISYVGATPADQQIIDDAGGIFNVETPYLVDLKPVLKIDGCEVAQGSGAVMMGMTHQSDMHFTAPTGASNQMPLVQNVISAGNYQGIGIDTEDALPAVWDQVETSCPEELLPQELHQTALTYLNNVDTADDEAASLMHIVVMNDVSEAIVENSVRILFSGELPITFEWTGMIVDADRKIIGPFSIDGQDNSCNYMRLTGADGSVQENLVFEIRYGEEAISTIKILQLAADSSLNVCTITTSIPGDCPNIDQPPQVIDAINAALAQGHHVIIPERGFAYYEWEGTAWIDLDPVSCAAGYIISGGISGGATVQTWDITYPDLFCIQPIGPVTVDPAATGDLYCAERTDKWTFTIPTIHYWGKDDEDQCVLLHTETNREFPVRYTIKYIAEHWGPGTYVFRAGSSTTECGCTTVEKEVTIVKVEIEHPDEDDIFLKGQEIAFVGKVTPDLGGLTYEWTVVTGTCDPATGSELTFETTLASENEIKVKLNVEVGGEDCEAERKVKAVIPEVIEVNFTGTMVPLKWHVDGSLVSRPTTTEWKRDLGAADPKLSHDAAYRSTASTDAVVKCKVKPKAPEALTDPVAVQVKADGNEANLNEQEDIFHDWSNWVDMDAGDALPKVIRQFTNNYDYTWYYRVKNLSGGWGDWVEMENNPTHHNISVVAGTIAATQYEWLVMNACKLADGIASTETPKTIADALHINLEAARSGGDAVITAADWAATNKLKYGHRMNSGAHDNAVDRILDDKIAMCGEWSQFFSALAGVHSVALAKKCYLLQTDAGTMGEQKWRQIVVTANGLNQSQPPNPWWTPKKWWDIDAGKYPFPEFLGNSSGADDVTYHSARRYHFSGPNDGHCINFLVHGGHNYLYDSSFGPYNAGGIKQDTYATVPTGRTDGAANNDFRTKYFNASVPYLLGRLWHRYADDTSLTAAINATVVVIPVASTAGADGSGMIKIDNELISYTGKTATSFTGCVRGRQGTAAAAHADGAAVAMVKKLDNTFNDFLLTAPSEEVEAAGLNLLWVTL